jgi:hypothetical protein
MQEAILDRDFVSAPVVQLSAHVQDPGAVVGMQMLEPVVHGLEALLPFLGDPADVAKTVVDEGGAFYQVDLVEGEAGEVGSRGHARLAPVNRLPGLAESGDHLLPVQRADEQLAEHAEALRGRVGPLALFVHGVEDDQVTNHVTGLDRKQQAGANPHLRPVRPLCARLERKVRQARDANGHAFDERLPSSPWEQLHQVDVRRHVRDPVRVGRQAYVHELLISPDRQEGAAIGPEELPDAIQGALDGTIDLPRRCRHERGGGVGDQRLELEPVLEVGREVA